MLKAHPLSDRPISQDLASSYADLWTIVTHPAFRLGFLDAQAGRPLAHEHILHRIETETPPRALKRIKWHPDAETESLFGVIHARKARQAACELAQYRYEEGRLAVFQAGLKCRAWGHPDYPPSAVTSYIFDLSRKRQSRVKPAEATACLTTP